MLHEATIAVVDDVESVRRSLRALLESANHAVIDFNSAEALLESGCYQTSDCIVADMRMPSMTGLDLQRELARRGATVPFIIVTGHADVPHAVSAMKAGAVDFIEKPYDGEFLLASVQRALEQRHGANVASAEAKAAEDLIATLTDREREVFNQLVLGQSNKLVALTLGISPRTVEVHRARIIEKMKARSLADLVRVMRVAEGREQPRK
jgi:two-component system response regulator FixJ